jgi:hypothetical protein
LISCAQRLRRSRQSRGTRRYPAAQRCRRGSVPRANQRGSVSTGTGADMAAHANVTEHLYECLGIICGRLREGEAPPNPGAGGRGAARAGQTTDTRFREAAAIAVRRRATDGSVGNADASGRNSDDLTRTRSSLIVAGGNPAAAIPDSKKVLEAFRALDLLCDRALLRPPRAARALRVAAETHVRTPPTSRYSLEMTNLSYPYAQHTACNRAAAGRGVVR